MENFESIKTIAFNIYKRKLQAGIPDNTPENNADKNWEEAREERMQVKKEWLDACCHRDRQWIEELREKGMYEK